MSSNPVADGVAVVTGAAVTAARGNTVDDIAFALGQLAAIGASPAVQQFFLTWLRERNGAPDDVVAAAEAKAGQIPPP